MYLEGINLFACGEWMKQSIIHANWETIVLFLIAMIKRFDNKLGVNEFLINLKSSKIEQEAGLIKRNHSITLQYSTRTLETWGIRSSLNCPP